MIIDVQRDTRAFLWRTSEEKNGPISFVDLSVILLGRHCLLCFDDDRSFGVPL